MCLSFGEASSSLCDGMSAFTRRICTQLIDPSGLQAFLANRLIPLDKNQEYGLLELVKFSGELSVKQSCTHSRKMFRQLPDQFNCALDKKQAAKLPFMVYQNSFRQMKRMPYSL